MDPGTIAASVVALLSPYLAKATEEFAGEAGKTAFEKAAGLWRRINAAFGADEPSAAILKAFELEPALNVEQLKAALEARMAADQQFANVISAEIDEIRRASPHVRVVQKMIEVETLVGVKAKRLRAGTVDVGQEVKTATNVTGVELDEIG